MKILNSNQSTYPIPVQRWSGRPAPDARGLAPLTVPLGLCWQKTMEGSLLRSANPAFPLNSYIYFYGSNYASKILFCKICVLISVFLFPLFFFGSRVMVKLSGMEGNCGVVRQI